MATLDWKFSQVFGDRTATEDVAEEDVVSAVEFDESGDLFAAGDKGGRIVVFERDFSKVAKDGKKSKEVLPEYKFTAEFQSHEPEFDYLKSAEIEEKVNQIKWCKKQNASRFLLTTNDKTVKLWKVFEKKVKAATPPTSGPKGIVIPKLSVRQTVVVAAPRRVFANAHAYHINSISLNTDGETFLSSDDLRVNIWSLGVSSESFTVVDIKPSSMEELTEVITAAEFHPIHCNQFMYSSSKGSIKLCDMRSSALCDKGAKSFIEEEDPASKSFFSEIISSISDIKFSLDGRHIISRDYLTLKVWDMAMENKPIKTIRIHDYLRPKLCDLYENDCIFDKFECAVSGDGKYYLTGSYNNYLFLYDWANNEVAYLEASKILPKTKKATLQKNKKKGGSQTEEMNPESVDFSKKILHTAWHPREHIIAISASNNLFLYSALGPDTQMISDSGGHDGRAVADKA